MKRIFAFILFAAAASCIDPYVPDLKNFDSLLVVEGLITNENNSYKITLRRTTDNENSVSAKVTDAIVFITDGEGIKTDLQNCGNGVYRTDSTLFRGVVGQKYTLNIHTSDGKDYRSDECTMIPVAGIDTIFYEKGDEIAGNPEKFYTGLKILLNTANADGVNQYFRWTSEETWMVRIPFPQQYEYKFINDTTLFFKQADIQKPSCWKRNQPSERIFNQVSRGGTNTIKSQEVRFIAPELSDRLSDEYSILVKQYSISKEEYDFWANLDKVGEPGGDIFGAQPYAVTSNIHNVDDNNELVLGYFEVSAVTQKRIFITSNELEPLDLPHFRTECFEIKKSPEDWPLPPNPGPWDLIQQPTWDEIYHCYIDLYHCVFVKPEVTSNVISDTVRTKDLVKLVFTTVSCAICDSSGFAARPDFWIDPDQ